MCVLSASSVNERWWMGIYRHLQKSNRYNIIAQLGETEVNLGGTDLHKMWQLSNSRRDRYRNLSGTGMVTYNSPQILVRSIPRLGISDS